VTSETTLQRDRGADHEQDGGHGHVFTPRMIWVDSTHHALVTAAEKVENRLVSRADAALPKFVKTLCRILKLRIERSWDSRMLRRCQFLSEGGRRAMSSPETVRDRHSEGAIAIGRAGAPAAASNAVLKNTYRLL
jgi:hypothetical protein